MNIIDIENSRLKLLKELDQVHSNRTRLLLIHNFFTILLESHNPNIISSYLLEFAEEYISALTRWNVYYLQPEQSEQILKLATGIREHQIFTPFRDTLEKATSRISDQIVELKNILNGKNTELNIQLTDKIHFPVIEEITTQQGDRLFAYLESTTVKISKGSEKNNFIIVPSLKIIEEKLENQIAVSWVRAIEIVKKYHKKVYPYYDVLINLDQKLGEYAGNSLGIALTLAFLQELFSFYNTPIKLTIDSGTAFSGGVNENGKIIPIIDNNFIRSKLECIFFSPIRKIVLHKSDEETARTELDRRLEIYPERKLKIIGVEDFDDLMNRRDLVKIHKQSILIRSAKYIYKYKVSAIFIILFILSIFYINIDFDNNPAIIKNVSHQVLVLNKNGKLLWEKEIVSELNPQIDNHALYEKIIDVNNDGVNEVLISQCILQNPDRNNFIGWVSCFNSKGNLNWKYQFTDSSKTFKDIHTTTYRSYFIGVDTKGGKKNIYLFAKNQPLYPSVIYQLDARTGKRIAGTFWHAGHILAAVLGDYEGSGKEIVALAISNCYERCDLFSLNVTDINGQAPALKNYRFIDIPSAKMNQYILLPKSDLTTFDKLRYNSAFTGGLIYQQEDSQFSFSLNEGDGYRDAGILYQVNNNLTNFNINIGDRFQIARDSLVSKGLLNKPYSNTKEYVNILKKQIEYWDGKTFRKLFNK